MARRGGELEAFTAFLGSLLFVGVLGLAAGAIAALTGVETGPGQEKAAVAVLFAVWVLLTLRIYLWLTKRGRTRSGTRS
ncbi:hypothetical protein [Kitasatospora sp. NPDC093806]|uniref:hypothetical protein n=1 Tax=Kitasatospora sp. NPDC093806 TaxID=3155075 RepID=UPI00341F1417